MNIYVKWLQETLQDLGYDPGVIDGIAGENTAAAVRKFQRDACLDVDGIVGEHTNNALLLKHNKRINETQETATAVTLKNFTSDEFACTCGCGLDVVNDLKVFAQELRVVFDWPLTISSGARCPTMNREAGGVPDSCHLTGEAFDAYFSGHMCAEVMAQMADVAVEQGIGVIRYPNSLFCHFQRTPRNDFIY